MTASENHIAMHILSIYWFFKWIYFLARKNWAETQLSASRISSWSPTSSQRTSWMSLAWSCSNPVFSKSTNDIGRAELTWLEWFHKIQYSQNSYICAAYLIEHNILYLIGVDSQNKYKIITIFLNVQIQDYVIKILFPFESHRSSMVAEEITKPSVHT